MRKSFLHPRFLLLLTFSFLLTFAVQAKHRIYLLHPTVGNIENMMDLIKERVIDIPDAEWIGLYHAKETYDYSLSEKYIKEKGIQHYTLQKVAAELNVKNVYGENGCSTLFREIVQTGDAILFFGGPDIQPALYGEKQHLLTEVTDPYRHLMETSLLFHLVGGSRNPGFHPLLEAKPGMIVRGFCLGMQTLNVAAGGTLIQDIPTEVYHVSTAEGMLAIDPQNRHRNYNTQLNPGCDLSWGILHPVRVKQSGYLFQLCKDAGLNPYVLTSHHQAVGKVGKDLEIIATSMDGKIVEGLQHKKFKEVVGVQFHPEQAVLYQPQGQFRMTPENSYSPNEVLLRERSLNFHREFWKDFSAKVMAL
ncbi:MAG: gamma-glutamyl-gamma-aminobutyrate hydrolase family protein [Marinilabiliales bacterium]|nr:gamma-glutamyl-gamma-aminobutyrate hydrolase family protein [Marinilabiliales bacterium]